MSTVTLPRAGITPIGYMDVRGEKVPVWIDQEWARAFNDLLIRVGGTTSNTITELNIAAFEDAGIAEQQAELHSVDSRYGQLPVPPVFPPEQDVSPAAQFDVKDADYSDHGVSELRARVAVLEAMIAGLMQGTAP
jgi:hypothetical protein